MVFWVLILVVCALCVRLGMLVRNGGSEAAARAQRQQRMVISVPGRAGSIFARTSSRYTPLAISRQIATCYADPSLLNDDELTSVSSAVGEALAVAPEQIAQKILRRRSGRFVYLKRGITEREVFAIRKLRIGAVRIMHEWRRAYPSEQLAATVVGFRRIDGVPGGGLELTQDAHMTAQAGRRVLLTDAYRRGIWPLADESYPPSDGASVLLCLDAVIQGYLQQAVGRAVEVYDAKWGTGVVVDPQTGRVLAMCSVPTFNPNTFNTAVAEHRTNRTVSVPFEPGSVLKPIIAAGAVQSGVVDYSTRIYCENGTYRAHRGGRITDHGKSFGELSVAEGVIFSSNIALAKIGEKLGNERIHNIVRRFGFGKPTKIELSGESAGIVRPLRKWNGYSLRRVPFGQEISVTALQLAMAFCSLSNGGKLLRPHLVDKVVDPGGKVLYQSRPEVVRRVLSPQVASQSLRVLQGVVERGTGRFCRLSQWTTFGKTGTAQISGPGGYTDGAYVGTFVGGAPVSEPRIVCLISIYWPDPSKGYYGATVAAPGVREVLLQTLRYLNVPPDKGIGTETYNSMAMAER